MSVGGVAEARASSAYFRPFVLLLGTSLLIALETPSKPFLDKNSFYLSSAGFKVHLANDAEGKKALHALPPHRFVIHNLGGGDVRYLYAEPQHSRLLPPPPIRTTARYSASRWRRPTTSRRTTRPRPVRC